MNIGVVNAANKGKYGLSEIYSRKEKHDNSKRNKRKNRTEKSA